MANTEAIDEMISLGSCPKCGGPAQFIGDGDRIDEVRHVDLSEGAHEALDRLGVPRGDGDDLYTVADRIRRLPLEAMDEEDYQDYRAALDSKPRNQLRPSL